MAKITLTGLGIKKLETGVKEVEYNGSIIEVMDYIPTPLKFALINDTLSLSYLNGIFNPLAIEAVFHALLIKETTNLSFSKSQSEHLVATYDLLNTTGLVDLVCDALGNEYDMIVEDLMKILDKIENKQKGFGEQLAEVLDSLRKALTELSTLDVENAELLKDVLEKIETPKQ